MFKIIFALILGIAGGLAGGYYYGEQQTRLAEQKILQEKQAAWTQELNSCQEKLSKAEEQSKTLSAELKLNEDRSCYVSSANLPPPEFDPPDNEPITNDKNGDILLKWAPVRGAKKYIVTVEDKDEKPITTIEVEDENSLYLNRIPRKTLMRAADFYVTIATVNGLDITGAPSPRKLIHFNDQKFKPTPKKTKSTSSKATNKKRRRY